jgi:hypothetical protein
MKPVASRTAFTEKFALTLIIALCAFFHSCKKTDDPRPHDPPPPAPGTKVGMLKDINVERLPSPYYHFDYTDQGVTTEVGFASGLYVYDVSYKNGLIDRMVNRIDRWALNYEYDNGKVVSIRLRKPNNSIVYHYTFDYQDNKVSEIRYYLASVSGADSIFFKKVLFFYYDNGNLERYEKYFDNTGEHLEWSITEKYSDYDNGKNVDGFRHYKDFFDHVLYLPGVQFMKNNPRRIDITTQSTDYIFNDTWTYANGLPVSKLSRWKETRGPNAGREASGNTTFSYY